MKLPAGFGPVVWAGTCFVLLRVRGAPGLPGDWSLLGCPWRPHSVIIAFSKSRNLMGNWHDASEPP
jgi:hypothetical protein